MLSRLIFELCPQFRRIYVVAMVALTVISAGAQGVSITGVGEGATIVLSPGTSTTNLSASATPFNSAGNTNVIFILERQGSILFNRTSPPPYSILFSNLTPGKYFLSALLDSPGTSAKGDVSFDISEALLAPTNDNWSHASALAGLNIAASSSNTYATGEPNEPIHGGMGVGKSVWWSWNAVSNGVFTATTAGSTFDTVLAVYQGTNLDTLVETGANDNAGANAFSQVTFSATNGSIYYFAVDSASAASVGKAQLRVLAGSPATISITSPADGTSFLVRSAFVTTNILAAASIVDSAGVARADYAFDGSTIMSQNGLLMTPYQLSLTNLIEGDYLLTLTVSNYAGMISVTNLGFSVISLAPVLFSEGFISNKYQMAFTGFKGPQYSVRTSTNLDVWCSLKTFTNFAGAEKVADTNATQFRGRFYRASFDP